MAAAESANQGSGKVWSFPATMGLSLIVWLAFNFIGFAVVSGLIAFYTATDPAFNSEQFSASVAENGHTLALVTTVSAPLCVGLTILLIRLRRGLPVLDYLALIPVKSATLLKWSAILILSMLAIEYISGLFDHPVASDYAVNAYRTAIVLPLFWIAVTVIGPIFEEVLFRGFLYKGIVSSRLGVGGAVLLSTLVWTLVHFQYETYELAIVFILGIILGLARAITGSLYTCLILHSLVNVAALTSASV